MNYYLIVVTENGPIFHYGPFTEQDRNDFACALWFGQPAREPNAMRGRRIPFNREKQNLYYTAVHNNRLSNFRNVTVGDLAKGACFPKDRP